MTTLENEIVAYEAMIDNLELDHFGKWVVFHNEKLAGSYETSHDAANDAMERFGRGPYLIRQVGLQPVVVWRPTIVYKPRHADD